jgi:integrase/recombinase XerD
LWPSTVHLLTRYKDTYRRNPLPIVRDRFFINQRCGSFTRFGVRVVVKKYLKLAARKCPSLTEKKLSTHSLRHTTAVHLLESKVEPNVIKAWLGHASISSTDRYLDTDLNHKRKILDQFGPSTYVTSITEPKPDTAPDKLLDWLKDL